MMLETVTAVCLMGLLSITLAMALHWQDRGLDQLAEARAASRAAEAALTALQSGGTPAQSPDVSLTITPLANSDVQGMQWVQVSAQTAGRTASLIGLAPNSTMGGAR
jgi:hypothetical protein